VVEQGALRNATTAVSCLTHSVGGRLVCLWLLGELGIYVSWAPLNAGKSINLTEGWRMDDTGCRGFFLEPVATSHRQYEALRAFFIEGRRWHDIAQQLGDRETSLRSLGCRFRAQVQAGEVPPCLCNRPWGAPRGNLKPQPQPSQRRQSSPMRAR
jgi:hypothetical protein